VRLTHNLISQLYASACKENQSFGFSSRQVALFAKQAKRNQKRRCFDQIPFPYPLN
jgi:hypothetical protein